MEGEYFYGAVLDKAGATATWNSSESREIEHDEQDHVPLFKLSIKQILLGRAAKEGEYNVVEVKTTSGNAGVKIPIAVLKVGETRSTMINLEFPESPVTFTLIEGSGPVYIHGNIVATYSDQVEEVLEDECVELVDDEQEDEGKEGGKAENKKRKMPETGSKATNAATDVAINGDSNNQKNNKKQKTG